MSGTRKDPVTAEAYRERITAADEVLGKLNHALGVLAGQANQRIFDAVLVREAYGYASTLAGRLKVLGEMAAALEAMPYCPQCGEPAAAVGQLCADRIACHHRTWPDGQPYDEDAV